MTTPSRHTQRVLRIEHMDSGLGIFMHDRESCFDFLNENIENKYSFSDYFKCPAELTGPIGRFFSGVTLSDLDAGTAYTVDWFFGLTDSVDLSMFFTEAALAELDRHGFRLATYLTTPNFALVEEGQVAFLRDQAERIALDSLAETFYPPLRAAA